MPFCWPRAPPLLVATLVLVVVARAAFAKVAFETYASCAERSESFDPASLQCATCSALGNASSTEPSPSGQGCQCRAGFRLANTIPPACVACPPNFGTSEDGSQCARCEGNTTVLSAGRCTCSAGDDFYVQELIVVSNSSSETVQSCRFCPTTHYISTDRFSCLPCPQVGMIRQGGVCTCPAGFAPLDEDTCGENAEVTSLNSQAGTEYARVQFQDVAAEGDGNSTTTIDVDNSAVFAGFLRSAAFRCQYATDEQACQLLGNLCVLQQYDEDTAACKLHKSIASLSPSDVNDFPDWNQNNPWLFVDPDTATDLRSEELALSFRLGTNEQSDSGNVQSRVTLLMAKYALNGTFVGFEEVTDQLSPCPSSSSSTTVGESPPYWRIGANWDVTCQVEAAAYQKGSQDSSGASVMETFQLFDLYVYDSVDQQLYPVLIRNLNMREGSVLINVPFDGPQVDIPSATQSTTERFVRRMFYSDSASGREGSLFSSPVVIRVPVEVTLSITFRPEDKTKIYTPTLTIKYRDVQDSELGSSDSESDSDGDSAIIQSRFRVVYQMDQQSYNAAFLGLLITVLVIAFFLFIVRMLALTRQRGSTELDLALLARGLAVLCDAVGDMLFWLSVLLGLYWLFFFKRQEKLNVLLPSALEDVKLLNIVITAAVCKTVRICELIYTQTQGSTAFLIDWEKSKGRILGRKMVAPPKDDNDNKDGPSVPAPGTNPYEPAPISVWRTLFVANEWNEIQAVRYTSLPLSLFVLLFLLEGLSWVGYTSPNPALTAEESRLYAANDASVGSLRFGLFVALWLCLEILFASFKYVIQRRWISDELQSFVDLLSVSNVSMLIFVEECFGYYIHGRTVHTYADCNMTGLHDNLKREEDGLTGTRGLEPNSDVQVFEVYCTREFREQYDRIFTFLVDQDLEERSDRGGIPGIRTLRVNTPQEKSIVAHHTISKFLSAFIDNTQPDFTYSVRTHSDALTSLLRRWLPSDMSYSKESVFFGTGTSQFGQALFLGREYDLFVWNVCVFGMLDLLVQNFYVAALVCYLTNLVAVMARSYFGSRTISRRSLIDSRFLL